MDSRAAIPPLNTPARLKGRAKPIISTNALRLGWGALLVLSLSYEDAAAQLNFVELGRNRVGSYTDHGGGAFTIVGGGNDICDNPDEFSFPYQEVTGDFDVRVRVASLTPNAHSSKAGLMARESLAEDSRMAFNRVTPPNVPTTGGGIGVNNTMFSYRTGSWDSEGSRNGGDHEDISLANTLSSPPYPNAWLRLTRSGSILTAYDSSDGATWQFMASQDTATWGMNSQAGSPPRALNPTLRVGLAASRHSGGPTATAEFHEYQLIQPGGDSGAFDLIGADSRGNLNGVRLEFTRPVGSGANNPFNYFIDNGVAVSAASIVPGNPNAVQLTTSTLSEGNTYTVFAEPLVDQAGTLITQSEKTFVHGVGHVLRLIHIYRNQQIPGVEISRYEASQAYALGLPTDNTIGRPGMESNTLFEDPAPDNDLNENFSSRIVGVLNITETGPYRFFCNSDDKASSSSVRTTSRFIGLNSPVSRNGTAAVCMPPIPEEDCY